MHFSRAPRRVVPHPPAHRGGTQDLPECRPSSCRRRWTGPPPATGTRNRKRWLGSISAARKPPSAPRKSRRCTCRPPADGTQFSRPRPISRGRRRLSAGLGESPRNPDTRRSEVGPCWGDPHWHRPPPPAQGLHASAPLVCCRVVFPLSDTRASAIWRVNACSQVDDARPRAGRASLSLRVVSSSGEARRPGNPRNPSQHNTRLQGEHLRILSVQCSYCASARWETGQPPKVVDELRQLLGRVLQPLIVHAVFAESR
jgi:hypothetical protein